MIVELETFLPAEDVYRKDLVVFFKCIYNHDTMLALVL